MDTSELQKIKQRYNIVGNCDELNRALDVALQVAPTDLSVLIIGESGVGKEIIPRIIHDNSPRRREKYFAINCGSIPEGTIDSELFGHEKGSFTGAIGESDGYFGTADKGTIFLDEVGELPLATQARLLRVLETGEYIRVGGQEIRKTNVRIVAATNVNMQKAVSEGRFREDLYYRLNTIPVKMPPLRKRGNDILLLFRLFTMQMAEKYNIPRISLTEDAKKVLLKYKWPGNVSEMRREMNDMRKQIDDAHKLDAAAAYPAAVHTIAPADQQYAPAYNMTHMRPSRVEEVEAEEIKDSESLNLNDLGRQMVERALEKNGGNRKKAAAELGISDRTLYRRIKQYGLDK